MASPITANATTNGANSVLLLWAADCAVSQDEVPPSTPAPSACPSAATSAWTASAVAASANRYSTCACAGVPADRRAVTVSGAAQASAELVIESAIPTIVNCG